MASSTTVGLFLALQLMCTGLSDAYPSTPITTTPPPTTMPGCDPELVGTVKDCYVLICVGNNLVPGFFAATLECCKKIDGAYPLCAELHPSTTHLTTTPPPTTTLPTTTPECDHTNFNGGVVIDCYYQICNQDNTLGQGFFEASLECCKKIDGQHPMCAVQYPKYFKPPY